MGLRNQTVRVFDTEAKAFVSTRKINVGEGPIVSLGRLDGYVFCYNNYGLELSHMDGL